MVTYFLYGLNLPALGIQNNIFGMLALSTANPLSMHQIVQLLPRVKGLSPAVDICGDPFL